MQRERHIYLNIKSREDALALFFKALPDYSDWPDEEIPVTESPGRITAKRMIAILSSPTANVSAMDGVAVRSADTFDASETTPVQLRLGQQAAFINTGETLPEAFDAVIKIEEIHQPGPGLIEIMASVPPWHYVRPIGEDIVVEEEVLPCCHLIRPYDIGALLSGGLTKVPVKKRPVVGIIPTGDEVVSSEQRPLPGQVIESNSAVLSALLTEWGAKAIRYPIVRDVPDLIFEKAAQALEHSDILIIIAGSSAGSRDYTADIISRMGEALVHGVGIMPGKPTILGIAAQKPVIGIPGYPVSACIAFTIFVRPVICRMLHHSLQETESLKATLVRKLPSKLGQEEYIRVRVGRIEGRYIATPLVRGAGIITSLVKADGILKIPPALEGIDAGSEVEVELLKQKREIDNALIFVGSHDPGLDLIADYLHRMESGFTLSLTHLGSLGGIMAMKRGECHLTGIHLLDPETGIYNIPYLRKYLPGERVYLAHLASRDQGLMVKKGNPKDIKGLEDIVRKDIRFVNRQTGAGTRLLLDYWLKKMGISSLIIRDYRREVFTHMAVAALVNSGGADCGLGILSAARALDLEFIPLAREKYDLLIPERHFSLSSVQAILKILLNPQFKMDLIAMGGYECAHTGEVECLN